MAHRVTSIVIFTNIFFLCLLMLTEAALKLHIYVYINITILIYFKM